MAVKEESCGTDKDSLRFLMERCNVFFKQIETKAALDRILNKIRIKALHCL